MNDRVLRYTSEGSVTWEFSRSWNTRIAARRSLEYIAQLSEVGVSGVEPTSHVSLAQDFDKYLFREDEVQGSLPVEESLANAPEPGHGHFKVPKVL